MPTAYVALLHGPDRADYDTSALRIGISGGAALPVEALRGFGRRSGSRCWRARGSFTRAAERIFIG